MTKTYLAISAIIFALVAAVHIARIVAGWPVRLGSIDVPMYASWIALVVSVVLAAWGGMLLRR